VKRTRVSWFPWQAERQAAALGAVKPEPNDPVEGARPLAFCPAEKQVETAMPQGDIEETKAVALLPNLKIEITHGRLPAGDAERLTISVSAVPSFEAFGRYLEAANPFLFWMLLHKRHGHPGLALFRHQRRQAPLAGFPGREGDHNCGPSPLGAGCPFGFPTRG
jgi:hypothetical protein